MKTIDVINSLRGSGVFNIFINKFQKKKPFIGDIDILAQRGSIVYCIEIKEVGDKNKEKKISEGIDQLVKDKEYIILDRSFLIKREKLKDYNNIKLILIVIISGQGSVYLFKDTINNKNKALERARILDFSRFIKNIERYLRFRSNINK